MSKKKKFIDTAYNRMCEGMEIVEMVPKYKDVEPPEDHIRFIGSHQFVVKTVLGDYQTEIHFPIPARNLEQAFDKFHAVKQGPEKEEADRVQAGAVEHKKHMEAQANGEDKIWTPN